MSLDGGTTLTTPARAGEGGREGGREREGERGREGGRGGRIVVLSKHKSVENTT